MTHARDPEAPPQAGWHHWPLLVLVALALQACEPWPRDPERTLERASGATLRVGVTEAAPLLTRAGDAAAGPEAELVEAFARSIDARVEWRWGGLDGHLELEQARRTAHDVDSSASVRVVSVSSG